SCCVLVTACSSASHPAAPATRQPAADAALQYVNAVNALCDGLAQKITALNGGQFDIPLKAYLAQLPQHTKLINDFDRHLAAIKVPKDAATEAQALTAYIAFADKLDAARLRTAQQGAATYRREIDAEKKTAVNDPSIAALSAAGFSQSCTAR